MFGTFKAKESFIDWVFSFSFCSDDEGEFGSSVNMELLLSESMSSPPETSSRGLPSPAEPDVSKYFWRGTMTASRSSSQKGTIKRIEGLSKVRAMSSSFSLGLKAKVTWMGCEEMRFLYCSLVEGLWSEQTREEIFASKATEESDI